MNHVLDFSEFLNEARVTVKRKYTEKHPETKVSDKAPIRERILAFVKEKKEVSHNDLMKFIAEMNEETGGNTSRKWVNKNTRYFNVKERNNTKLYSLSAIGKRIHETLSKNKPVNEGLEEKED
jgi:hypothetical protein